MQGLHAISLSTDRVGHAGENCVFVGGSVCMYTDDVKYVCRRARQIYIYHAIKHITWSCSYYWHDIKIPCDNAARPKCIFNMQVRNLPIINIALLATWHALLSGTPSCQAGYKISASLWLVVSCSCAVKCRCELFFPVNSLVEWIIFSSVKLPAYSDMLHGHLQQPQEVHMCFVHTVFSVSENGVHFWQAPSEHQLLPMFFLWGFKVHSRQCFIHLLTSYTSWC